MRFRILAAALAAIAAMTTLTACPGGSATAKRDRVFTIVDRPKGSAYVLCSHENGPTFRVNINDFTASRITVGDTCPKASRS